MKYSVDYAEDVTFGCIAECLVERNAVSSIKKVVICYFYPGMPPSEKHYICCLYPNKNL